MTDPFLEKNTAPVAPPAVPNLTPTVPLVPAPVPPGAPVELTPTDSIPQDVVPAAPVAPGTIDQTELPVWPRLDGEQRVRAAQVGQYRSVPDSRTGMLPEILPRTY
ncbi:MAG: hypothetical protein KDA91_02315 [Planctomycetaceae bacterium]|nr:hypothetical protein [Planctomycetaceae bacterium]